MQFCANQLTFLFFSFSIIAVNWIFSLCSFNDSSIFSLSWLFAPFCYLSSRWALGYFCPAVTWKIFDSLPALSAFFYGNPSNFPISLWFSLDIFMHNVLVNVQCFHSPGVLALDRLNIIYPFRCWFDSKYHPIIPSMPVRRPGLSGTNDSLRAEYFWPLTLHRPVAFSLMYYLHTWLRNKMTHCHSPHGFTLCCITALEFITSCAQTNGENHNGNFTAIWNLLVSAKHLSDQRTAHSSSPKRLWVPHWKFWIKYYFSWNVSNPVKFLGMLTSRRFSVREFCSDVTCISCEETKRYIFNLYERVRCRWWTDDFKHRVTLDDLIRTRQGK